MDLSTRIPMADGLGYATTLGAILAGAGATIVYTNAGAPSNGTSGTLAGVAAKGALLVDTTNAVLYMNSGTLASPTWAAETGTVAITGGTIDGTVIGATTQAAAAVTELRVEGTLIRAQGAPAAKTVSATLTAAELLGGIITVAQGAAGVSNLQSPTGTALQTALPADFATGDSFDVVIINTSSTATEIANLTVNTGVTIVGTAAVAPIAAGAASQGVFRFRKTAANTFVAYRIH
ncbi:MAG TPA: hypothetical protein VIM74_02410 [Casimicrobiaceae bacterium]